MEKICQSASDERGSLPPGAKMFHDLIWDLGICSIESIEPNNLFISVTFRKRSLHVSTFIGTMIKLCIESSNNICLFTLLFLAKLWEKT